MRRSTTSSTAASGSAIVAYLSAVERALFSELRDKVGATDGNLSAHLRKLEDAGYVRVDKSFVGRKPQTRLALTDTGRKAWQAWLSQIELLRRAAAGDQEFGLASQLGEHALQLHGVGHVALDASACPA